MKKHEKFIGDKYDYSKVEYKGVMKKIKIICHIHGEFEITPNSHLSGHGCQICANNQKHSLEQFIEKARKVHRR